MAFRSQSLCHWSILLIRWFRNDSSDKRKWSISLEQETIERFESDWSLRSIMSRFLMNTPFDSTDVFMKSSESWNFIHTLKNWLNWSKENGMQEEKENISCSLSYHFDRHNHRSLSAFSTFFFLCSLQQSGSDCGSLSLAFATDNQRDRWEKVFSEEWKKFSVIFVWIIRLFTRDSSHSQNAQ